MKITNISAQVNDKDRVNIFVDGKFHLSLDIFQVADLGVKVGNEYTEAELVSLQDESSFGKLYGRTLEYTLLRPHSAREIREYLRKKTLSRKVLRNPRGPLQGSTLQKEVKTIEGMSQVLTDRVFDRLSEKGYVDDEKFARWWVENRNQTKGASRRKLNSELRAKGVEQLIIDQALGETDRNDASEIEKIIAKKRSKYPDDQKFMRYLTGQGFGYNEIKRALSEES